MTTTDKLLKLAIKQELVEWDDSEYRPLIERAFEDMTKKYAALSTHPDPAQGQHERAAFMSQYPKAIWDSNLKGFTEPMYNYAFVGFKAGRASIQSAPVSVQALSEEDVNKAAKKIAAHFDYPWEYMPNEGKEYILTLARALLTAEPVKTTKGDEG